MRCLLFKAHCIGLLFAAAGLLAACSPPEPPGPPPAPEPTPTVEQSDAAAD